jgi:hypothetical protein
MESTAYQPVPIVQYKYQKHHLARILCSTIGMAVNFNPCCGYGFISTRLSLTLTANPYRSFLTWTLLTGHLLSVCSQFFHYRNIFMKSDFYKVAIEITTNNFVENLVGNGFKNCWVYTNFRGTLYLGDMCFFNYGMREFASTTFFDW